MEVCTHAVQQSVESFFQRIFCARQPGSKSRLMHKHMSPIGEFADFHFLPHIILYILHLKTSRTMFKLSLFLSFIAICNVSNGEIVDWKLQESQLPYAPITMFAGDTITFQYPGENIDVYLHPSGTCNDNGAELVGAGGAGTATYTFKDSQIDTNVTFACQYWNYCEMFGMIIDVLVLEPPPSSSPTNAPSRTAAPTMPQPTLAPVAAPVVGANPTPTSGTETPDAPTSIESGAASMGAAVSLLLSAFVLLM